MAYTPAPPRTREITWQINWFWHRTLPKENRTLCFSPWSRHAPKVSDPAGISDSAEIWLSTIWLSVHIMFFRNTQ